MTREEALAALQKLIDDKVNQEDAHEEADGILCALLESLGYKDVVELFDQIDKWYQ